MQIILNDYSLNGQFTDIPDFCDFTSEYILPCLIFCEKQEYEILKSYNTFNRKITINYNFAEVLRNSNAYPELQKIKTQLVQLFYNNPYWDENIQTPTNISADCKTEVFFRKGILISYKRAGFDESKIHITIDEKQEVLLNASDKNQLLENLDKLKVFDLSNSFILPNSNLKVEIRTKEDHHNEPHFHISNNSGTNVSIYFKDFEIHNGSSKSNDSKIFMDWLSVEKNRYRLIELWKYYHPSTIINP